MEPQVGVDVSKKSFNAVFQNPLLVRTIFSFTSGAELLSLRGVNYIMHREATRRLRMVHKRINLEEESSIDKFLTVMKTRLEPHDDNSYPFVAFTLNLQNSAQSFERFAAEAGQHIQRLHFKPTGYLDVTAHQPEVKIISLLKHTPNLTKIDLETLNAVHVPHADVDALPQSFPQLRTIDLNYKLTNAQNAGAGDSVSLLSLLISRSTTLLNELGIVRIQDHIEKNDGLAILRDLLQHHGQRVPMIRQGVITFGGVHTTPVIQELMNMNLCFKNFHAMIVKHVENDIVNGVQNQIAFQSVGRQVSDFLASQSPNLKNLCVCTFVRPQPTAVNLTLPIPPLAAVEEFRFCYLLPQRHPAVTLASLHVPLSPNQFPALKFFQLVLVLATNHDIVVTFDDSRQDSVEEFDVRCDSSLVGSNPWHRIFPNLRTISIHFSGYNKPYEGPNLAYILKHFPRITTLEFNTKPNTQEEVDYWSILTGDAPKPNNLNTLLNVEMEQEAEETAEIVDGVYSVASLGNLKALKTLKCRPGSRTNLNAILYMTRIGRLVPLQKLILTAVVNDLGLQVREKTVYHDHFAKVHAEVCLMDQVVPNTNTVNLM